VAVLRDYDAVLFDLDDTLHDDTAAYRSAAEDVARDIAVEHGVDARVLAAAYAARTEGFWMRLTPDDLRRRLGPLRAQMWRSALEDVGIADPLLAEEAARRYDRYRAGYLTPYPGAIELLQELRARGKRLGLLTNGFAETHREKVAVLRLSGRFDALFFADEVGMVKPDPLLFAHACTTLGCAPARSVMVGDRYERDVHGALEAGLAAIWMNVRNERLPAGAPPPTAVVRTLGEVRGLLLGESGARPHPGSPRSG